MTAPLDPPRLEIFADIWCPFAHVGINTAFALRREMDREDVAIVIRPWPLEWVNGAPMEPHKAADNARALREQVAPELFANVNPDDFPSTTIPALALSLAAYDASAATGEAMSRAIRWALFEEGRNISSPPVLTELARSFDLDPSASDDEERVRAQWHAGQSAGVVGSPHFFAGTTNVFCPVLDIRRDEGGVLHLRRDGDDLRRFLTDYWSTH